MYEALLEEGYNVSYPSVVKAVNNCRLSSKFGSSSNLMISKKSSIIFIK